MAKGAEVPDFEGFGDELSTIIAAGEQDGREMTGLKQMRAALRKVGRQIEEAEQRGYARAQTEAQTRGVLASKGVPEIAAHYFSETNLTDPAAVDARIQELAKSGIRFEAANPGGTQPAAPSVPQPNQGQPLPPTAPNPQAGTGQVDQAALQAALANVTITPGMTPEAVIAAAVGQMTKAQAGGQSPGSTGDIVTQIREAAADPGKLTDEARYALADQLNRELDATSQAMAGRPILG